MAEPDRWRRIQQLCEALESVPAAERARRLRDLEADPGIRAEALSLLEAADEEARAQRTHAPQPAAAADIPDRIGPYRIVERMGVGGSGEVFKATRAVNGVLQAVALKRFHAHRSSREHLDRFAREQQMLAALRHPDIVHFMDAGLTDDGRPYLVMDLAEGEPITAYCGRRALKVSQRIGLMTSVCEAVQAAHRQLIVHLDLKPSNILVSDAGRVKLLDFGTAKLIDASEDGTRTQSLTLQYASPEQLRGEPVSAACDIYSLGLILYELVSGGGWPFRRPETLISAAERAAGRLEPASLRPAAGSDLDAICRKAIAHDPAERYATAADLAEDLRRLERGEPVRARPASTAYKTSKFVRRHRWTVGAAAVIFLSLSAAAIYSVIQMRIARLATDRALSANQFLTSVLTITGNDAASRNGLSVLEMLRLAEKRITPTLGNDPIVAADIEIALAMGFESQDAYPESRALFERARARASAAGSVPREAAARAGVAYLMYLQSETADAWKEAIAALESWRRQPAAFTAPQAASVLAQGARTLSYLKPADLAPRPYFTACLDIATAASRDVPRTVRAECLLGLATSYTMVDSHYDQAEPLLDEALIIQRADPAAVLSLATTLQMRGMVGRYQGRFDEDERAQREAYEIDARLRGADSMPAVWQRAVWALSLTGVNRVDDAYRESREVLGAARKLVSEPASYMLWTPLITATAAACHAGHYEECEAHAREALATLGPAPARTDTRPPSARGYLGVALSATRRCAEAMPLLQEAIASNASHGRKSAQTPLLESALARCR